VGANAHLHSFEAHGDLSGIHRNLLDDGVSDHLLLPSPGGATVYVVDIGDWAYEAVGRASARHGDQFRSEVGRAEFIPPIIIKGTDREQRSTTPGGLTRRSSGNLSSSGYRKNGKASATNGVTTSG